MASEVKCDLRFEICDLNYPHIHVHVTFLIPEKYICSWPALALQVIRGKIMKLMGPSGVDFLMKNNVNPTSGPVQPRAPYQKIYTGQ